jgi:hypothetical protein
MADERILSAVRRFWTTRAAVEEKYLELLNADWSKVKKLTIIVGKSTEGESASAQVVVTAEERLAWMEAFETRLLEMDREEAGHGSLVPGSTSVDFSQRILET